MVYLKLLSHSNVAIPQSGACCTAGVPKLGSEPRFDEPEPCWLSSVKYRVTIPTSFTTIPTSLDDLTRPHHTLLIKVYLVVYNIKLKIYSNTPF